MLDVVIASDGDRRDRAVLTGADERYTAVGVLRSGLVGPHNP
jgi:hypothetical protein